MGGRLVGPGTGLAVAFLTAISPHLVNINIYLLTESLFAFWFWMSMMIVLAGSSTQPRPAVLVAAGLTMALAALTRPTVQYLPFLLLLAGLLQGAGMWRRWGLMAGAFCLVA